MKYRVVLIVFLLLSNVFAGSPGSAVMSGDPCEVLDIVSVDFQPGEGYLKDVVVKRADGHETSYARSNRGLHNHFLNEHNKQYYPSGWYEAEKLARDKEVVLDAACGDGQLVKDFIDKNVKAEGFDLVVTPDMHKTPGKPFFTADFSKIERPDKTYTIIYAHHGPFEYMKESDAFYRKALFEMHRVLKTGGVIRIVPVGNAPRIYQILYDNPSLGLQVSQRREPDWKGFNFLELRRVD